MTKKVALHYLKITQQYSEDVHFLSLEDFPFWEDNDKLKELQERFLIPADKFMIIVPEYNGSFSGILKFLIDKSDIRRCWNYKKIMLTGVADGRAGNLRGLDHLTNIFNYMKATIYYNKLPISRINEEMDAEGNFKHEMILKVIADQVEGFVKF